MSGFKATKCNLVKFITIFIAVFMSAVLIFAVGCSADSDDTNGVEGSSSSTAEENNLTDGTSQEENNSDDSDNTQAEENSNDSEDNNAQEDGEMDEGGIVIDTSTITTTAKFYDVTIDGLTVEVLAVKATDTTIRLAFNTCQVCNGSTKAYFVQSGYYLVCQNCKSTISINKVGQTSGSCNPVPITSDDYTESNGIITISQSYLESKVSLFKKWKDN